MRNLITLTSIIIALNINAQAPTNWVTTGNNSFSSPTPYIGTNAGTNLPFRIFTNGIHRASFTYDGSESADNSSTPCNGLRIFDQANPQTGIGVLDY